MSQQPSSQTALYTSMLDTADAYVCNHRELEGRAICLDLLNKPDLTTGQKARAHLNLAACGEDRAFHARQSVSLYESTAIIGDELEDKRRETFIGLAKNMLFGVLWEEGKRGEAEAVAKSAGAFGAPAQTSQEYPINMPKFFHDRYLEANELFQSGCASRDQDKIGKAFDVCEELLLYPDLPTYEKASAHLLLASSSVANSAWHAKQAEELFERVVADAVEAGNPEVEASARRFLEVSKSAVEESGKRENKSQT